MKKLLPILLICPILSFADTFNCKVVGIADGDTITCLTDDKVQHKIRLYQIDAPGSKQDFGSRSKQTLSDLIFNKTVEIETHGKDRYKRTLGTIYLWQLTSCAKSPVTRECSLKKDINLSMIQQGMAWYWPFEKKNDLYKQAEEQARANKIGLWSQKAIAPWEFRKNNSTTKL